MKSAVYIPDELWDRAQAKAQAHEPTIGENKSKVVQMALEHFVAEPQNERPAFARDRPAWGADEVARVRKRLLRQARRQYETGYRHGIQLVEQLTWDSISWLSSLGWDADEWTRVFVAIDWFKEEYRDSNTGRVVDQIVLTDTGRGLFIPCDFYRVRSESAVYQKGYIEAVSDVWESISGPKGQFPTEVAALDSEEDLDDPEVAEITDPDELPFV